MTTRYDVLTGQVEPKRLAGGVEVPPEGQINGLSLREKLQHQRGYKGNVQFPLFTRAEALAVGYGEAEVKEVYGDSEYAPDDPRHPQAAAPFRTVSYDDTQLLALIRRHLFIEFPDLAARRVAFRLRHRDGMLHVDMFEEPK